jgi:hypothetical protein
VIGFKHAFRVAGEQYREELALLADAHRRQMATLAATYDRELANLSSDLVEIARSHREELRRRAIDEAQAEREQCPWRLLH